MKKATGKGFENIGTHRGAVNQTDPVFEVYSSDVKPGGADPLGLWVSTPNMPFKGILHFPHEFMQKQPNLMQGDYAERVWKCFPLDEEWMMMFKFADSIDQSTLIKYTPEEESDINE